MSTLVKRLGIIHDCTPMDGERRCRTALPFPWTVPQMSLDVTFANLSKPSSGTDVQRK
jgi:hypothetical protein